MLRERLPSLRYGSPFNDEMIARFGLRPAAKRRRGTGG